MFDSIETWVLSLDELFAEREVTATFSRSGGDRPNPSCSLNLRRGGSEADLVMWGSGEAELVLAAGSGCDPVQEHLEDVTGPQAVARTLARMISAVGLR